ncbi:MAG TPA: hypothetical protein VM451_03010 [Candidatus Limnocylindria bacterium]|nr:hypothetical protein [Candidatus Limnocylindria bacterium]
MFGLFDPEGWGWATTKAGFWLLVIIMALGYVPDRAYYFVVSRTIDLGILGWSPVNLCPPENGTNMPCPVPAGALVPWQGTAADVALPAARSDGAAAQLGTNLLYIGGSDGNAPVATTYVSQVANGVFGAWAEGPALPEARADAALAILSGTAYLVGGAGPGGATDTVWKIGLDPDTSALKAWEPAKIGTGEDATDLKLPEPRAGASAVAVTDGIVIAGGRDANGAPSTKVWKSTIDTSGNLGEFKEQPPLLHAVADATMALEGTYLWVFGGNDANGPTATVQRASYGVAAAAAGSAAPGASAAAPSPAASGGIEGVVQWAVNDAANLPGARGGAAGWVANGALYIAGGADGIASKREVYWALPNANGDLADGWRHLDQTDLPAGVVDSATVVSGVNVYVLGGEADGAPATGGYRANLAPQAPFFQLGLVGLVVPGLQIGGEIGQQLGYLAAAGVGTGNFVILVAVGWVFNNREKMAGWWRNRRAEREARAPKEA